MSPSPAATPDLALWAATLGATTAPQYVGRVRKFFTLRGDRAPETVTRDELVEYCAAPASRQKRWGLMGALDNYFEFLERHDGIPHPAPGLAKKVAALRDRRELAGGLTGVGVTESQAAALRWRDVARDVVGPTPSLPPNLDAKIRARLVGDLLDRMRTATPDTISAVLDHAVLD